jgi:hypothetical protein
MGLHGLEQGHLYLLTLLLLIFFNSTSQLGPFGTLATKWLIVPAPGDYEDEELEEWWLAGETKVLGENLPQCHFVHHKSHMNWPDAKPDRRVGNPATNRLSYDTAYVVYLFLYENTFDTITFHFRFP